jgi:hypothetical protein
MRLFTKISTAIAIGLGVGMGAMAFHGGTSENKVKTMVELFETYCAPLYRGEVVPFTSAFIPLNQFLNDNTLVETTSKLSVNRTESRCAVSDEFARLNSKERDALLFIYREWIGTNFPELSQEYNSGLSQNDLMEYWSNGEKHLSKRIVISISRFQASQDDSTTMLSIGIPTIQSE